VRRDDAEAAEAVLSGNASELADSSEAETEDGAEAAEDNHV